MVHNKLHISYQTLPLNCQLPPGAHTGGTIWSTQCTVKGNPIAMVTKGNNSSDSNSGLNIKSTSSNRLCCPCSEAQSAVTKYFPKHFALKKSSPLCFQTVYNTQHANHEGERVRKAKHTGKKGTIWQNSNLSNATNISLVFAVRTGSVSKVLFIDYN